MTPTELDALIQKLRKYTGPWTVPAEAAAALERMARELARAKFGYSGTTNAVLQLLQDGQITVSKAREWLNDYISAGVEGPLPEYASLGESTWDEIDRLKGELSAAIAQKERCAGLTAGEWRALFIQTQNQWEDAKAERDALQARGQELERERDDAVWCCQQGWIEVCETPLLHVSRERDALRAQLAEREKERDERTELLEMMWDHYENGDPCYEDPENADGYMGNAVKLSDAEWKSVLAVIPRMPSAGLHAKHAAQLAQLAERDAEIAGLREDSSKLLDLCHEVTQQHADSDDPYYNDCDQDRCAWCEQVAVIAARRKQEGA